MVPETRSEIFLASIAGEEHELPAPQSRIEHYLNAIAQAGDIHGGSAGAVIYDKDASYPDGSVGAAMQDMDDEIAETSADVSELKSQINEVEASFPQKSASGSIVTIDDGADNVPVVSLEAEINPVQDLHGYDAPCPAGGGKNKAQITQDSGTVGDVTFTAVKDPLGNILYLKASGNITANANIPIATAVIPSDGSYRFSGLTNGSNTTATIQLRDSTDTIISTRVTDESSSISLTAGTYTVVYRVLSGATISNMEIKPMVRLSSSEAGFSPYSNICPISGWTGANVFDTGVNVWNPNRADAEHGYYNEIGVFNENNAWVCLSFPCSEGMSFTKSGSDWGGLVTFWNNESFVSSANVTTATIPSGVNKVKFACKASSTDAQLEIGSTASPYHAYNGSVTPITFPDEAGTVYGGSLVLNQDGTADLTVTGVKITATWGDFLYKTVLGSYERKSFELTYPSVYPPTSAFPQISNLATYLANFTSDTLHFYCNGAQAIFFLPVNTPDSTEIQVCYELATPVTYHIENVELVKTLLGLNNIWADTGDVSLTYRADPSMYTAEQIQTMLNAMVAPVEATTTASKAYSVNDFLIYNNVLYKVDSPIANGGTITIGTNVHATTVGAELTAILNS